MAKTLSVSVAVPPAPVRAPSQRPLAPSATLVTSVANDKGDNEMILEAVHRTSGICITAVENPRKPQLGDRLMKGLCVSQNLLGPLHKLSVVDREIHVIIQYKHSCLLDLFLRI